MAKKLARRAEAQLYSLNNGATTQNNSGGGGSGSVAAAETLTVLGAQGGGTVVSLSNNDFKQDAQRYRDSLPQDNLGPKGPPLQIKRWNTQAGEVTTSGKSRHGGQSQERDDQCACHAIHPSGERRSCKRNGAKSRPTMPTTAESMGSSL
jgi:hypothetical protein